MNHHLLTAILTPIIFSTLILASRSEDSSPPIPNLTPLECGMERPTPPEDYLESYYLENGLEVFMYDSNHDGKFDAQLSLPQGDQNRYPLFYMFDRTYNGEPDILYQDHLRDGSCENIEWKYLGEPDPQV